MSQSSNTAVTDEQPTFLNQHPGEEHCISCLMEAEDGFDPMLYPLCCCRSRLSNEDADRLHQEWLDAGCPE